MYKNLQTTQALRFQKHELQPFLYAHQAPTPEPIEDPLPGDHPVPFEEPVPFPHPELIDRSKVQRSQVPAR